MKNALLLTFAICLLMLSLLLVSGEEALSPTYLSPLPGATSVSAETSIAIRYPDGVRFDATPTDNVFTVTGSKSGSVTGQLTLAKDARTLLFYPDAPFAANETVTVKAGYDLAPATAQRLAPTQFTFTTKADSLPEIDVVARALKTLAADVQPIDSASATQHITPTRAYETAPFDFPTIHVITQTNHTDDGYVFTSNFTIDFTQFDFGAGQSYLLILDNNGEPVFYRRMPENSAHFDFKRLEPFDLLTYFDGTMREYVVLDQQYDTVDTWAAGNGYATDNHDMKMLPNGNVLIMGLELVPMDLTALGGSPDAIILGMLAQELDAEKNVIFEWRSIDHVPVTDSIVDLTTGPEQGPIDYIHPNAIEKDSDGNILISNRHTQDIIKINFETGDVMWRLGGLANDFTFLNDPDAPFFLQHDILRLPNGNVSLFDNRWPGSTYSRGVEFDLDESNLTADLVWEYRGSEPYSRAMGNMQTLPNGNRFFGWGATYPTASEVDADGNVVWQMSFAENGSPDIITNSYRSFRWEWEGTPTWQPRLVDSEEMGMTTFTFSYNGATNVASYDLYGGASPDNMWRLGNVVKSGFEETVTVSSAELGARCFFQVVPLTATGEALTPSNLLLADHCTAREIHFPLLSSE